MQNHTFPECIVMHCVIVFEIRSFMVPLLARWAPFIGESYLSIYPCKIYGYLFICSFCISEKVLHKTNHCNNVWIWVWRHWHSTLRLLHEEVLGEVAAIDFDYIFVSWWNSWCSNWFRIRKLWVLFHNSYGWCHVLFSSFSQTDNIFNGCMFSLEISRY